MNTRTYQITIGTLCVDVVPKAIKNLHLGVYPPHGRVRVAAPDALTKDAIRMAVIGKLGWIKKQQARFNDQLRQSEREMVNGESHFFLGRRYRLRVREQPGRTNVSLRGVNYIEICVNAHSDAVQREQLLLRWYRKELRTLIPPIIEKWEAQLGIEVAEWGIKKMKTKWGSCNPSARRIWLNLELAKKPLPCLEYIVVHEMVHLLERRHNNHFKELMDNSMPQWRLLRDELNQAPLAHEKWKY